MGLINQVCFWALKLMATWGSGAWVNNPVSPAEQMRSWSRRRQSRALLGGPETAGVPALWTQEPPAREHGEGRGQGSVHAQALRGPGHPTTPGRQQASARGTSARGSPAEATEVSG